MSAVHSAVIPLLSSRMPAPRATNFYLAYRHFRGGASTQISQYLLLNADMKRIGLRYYGVEEGEPVRGPLRSFDSITLRPMADSR
jgi:hypothetical protein